MTSLVAVVLALAVYRLTVLVTKDYIAEPLRSWMRGELAPIRPDFTSWNDYRAAVDEWRERKPRRFGHHLAYLSSCPWCCSIWAAAVLVPLTALVSWWAWVDAGLASSAVAGIVFERVNE